MQNQLLFVHLNGKRPEGKLKNLTFRVIGFHQREENTLLMIETLASLTRCGL